MKKEYISMRKINLDINLRKNADKEYENRINSPSAIVFDIRINDRPLFVMLTPRLLASIVNVHKQRAILGELQMSLPEIALDWFIKTMLIDEIKLTNDIENVQSTRREVKEALDSVQRKERTHAVRFGGMANKYVSLLTGKTALLKTCQDVRDLYDGFVRQEVMTEDEKDEPDGQIFRKDHVFVRDGRGNVIHEGLYPEAAIIDMTERSIALLNDENTDFLIRVAVFHYLFGYIHPFYNGNGRLSRYISSMYLSGELGRLSGLRLSYIIKEHKKQYDRLFKETNDKMSDGDLTDFTETFCGYVESALADMIETLRNGREKIENIRQTIDQNPAFKNDEKIINILALNGVFAEDALSIDDLMQYADCGRKRAQAAIDTVRNADILTQSRQGRKYVYTIDPDVWADMPEQ